MIAQIQSHPLVFNCAELHFNKSATFDAITLLYSKIAVVID